MRKCRVYGQKDVSKGDWKRDHEGQGLPTQARADGYGKVNQAKAVGQKNGDYILTYVLVKGNQETTITLRERNGKIVEKLSETSLTVAAPPSDSAPAPDSTPKVIHQDNNVY